MEDVIRFVVEDLNLTKNWPVAGGGNLEYTIQDGILYVHVLRGLLRLVRKYLGRVTKHFAQQSPNTEPTDASSSGQDHLHPQKGQDFPPPTITPELNPDQSSDSEQPDPKVVKEKLVNAKWDLDRITHVSGMVKNTASAPDNLQSASNMIDTFSLILAPLRVFNTIATTLADVHPYVKVALSIFTFVSKVNKSVWTIDDS
ncbi:hypothetical protein BDR06DRAFT_968962 [Suillus hirtellus]|nr:hypothetical protein BDR06DRAFT_968962 [Suillus hirtellus]